MTDGVISGLGNSRFIKLVADFLARYPTYESAVAAGIAGSLPIDLNGIDPSGWDILGTLLNKANLLSDTTAAALGLTGDPTVNDALNKLTSLIKDNPYLWDGPKKLGSLPAGALVKLDENGRAKKFIVLDNDHYGPGTGVTLIRKDTFVRQARVSGSGSYADPNIGIYMGCTLDNFCDGIWPLKLDEEIRECIVPVPIVVAESSEVATLRTIYRKGFALSCTETQVAGWQTEGTAFTYFDSNDKRIAFVDETETANTWGLRSPIPGSYGYPYAYTIRSNGTPQSDNVVSGLHSPRPAFNLKSDMVISNTPDDDGCYTFVKKGDAQ